MKNAVEIVMRSKNDVEYIGDVINAVRRQAYPGQVRFVHIDSGSRDGTLEVIQRFAPWKLICIRPEEYIPGRVLNRGMRETTGEWVVFLNSDAQPADARWLSELMAVARSTPRLGAAFSRQLPRSD